MTPAKDTHTKIQRFRLDDETWNEYGELVGKDRRSADLRAYIEWRLANPTRDLPGRRSRRRVRGE